MSRSSRRATDSAVESSRQPGSHRNENAHWFSGSSWIFQRGIHELALRMQMHADPRRALLRAFSLINSSPNNQAQLSAHVDDLRYIALLCFICVPSAFLLKKASKSGAE